MTVQRRRTVRRLAVVVVLVGLGAGFSSASASQVNVASSAISTSSIGQPCSGTLTATNPGSGGPVSTVSVTAPGCLGHTVQVAVTSGGVTVQSTTTTTLTAGANTVQLSGSYTPSATTQVAAVVDGWNMPTTWTYTPPSGPATCAVAYDVSGWGTINGVWSPILVPAQDPAGCSVTKVDAGSSWTSNGMTYAQYDVTFRNDTPREIVWRGTLNFSVSPFPGWTPKGIVGLGNGTNDGWNARIASTCALLPKAEIVGNPGSTQVLRPGDKVKVGFQVISGPAGDFVCP